MNTTTDTWIEQEIARLDALHKKFLRAEQNINEPEDEVLPVADTLDVGIAIRYLTVDDLPKAPRHILPPKKIRPATHAKKLHRFLKRMKRHGESVTHIKTGKTWGYDDKESVTPETFLEYII